MARGDDIGERRRGVIELYGTRQFALFVLVGGVALAAHWLARLAFSLVLPFWQAVVCAYAIGIAVAYALNRMYVFPRSERGIRSELIIFVAVNLLGFPVVWALSVFLGDTLLPGFMPIDIARGLGHAIAICTPVFANFAAHKFWTFGGRRQRADVDDA